MPSQHPLLRRWSVAIEEFSNRRYRLGAKTKPPHPTDAMGSFHRTGKATGFVYILADDINFTASVMTQGKSNFYKLMVHLKTVDDEVVKPDEES